MLLIVLGFKPNSYDGVAEGFDLISNNGLFDSNTNMFLSNLEKIRKSLYLSFR